MSEHQGLRRLPGPWLAQPNSLQLNRVSDQSPSRQAKRPHDGGGEIPQWLDAASGTFLGAEGPLDPIGLPLGAIARTKTRFPGTALWSSFLRSIPRSIQFHSSSTSTTGNR